MAKTNITARDCTTRVTERTKIYDGKVPGFYVSVTPRGVATFNFKFTNPVTKGRESVEIGKYDPVELTVEQARAKALGLAARVGAGEDISQSLRRQAAQAAKLHGKKVAEIIDEYVEWMKEDVKKADGEMRPRIESWDGRKGYLDRFIRPSIGHMVGAEVENDHIGEIQNKIVTGKFVGADGKRFKKSLSNARNMRGAASAMFEWAAEAGRRYIKFNPCRNLPELDPEVERDRVLTADEIKMLWWGLDRDDLPCSRRIALALKLELVTMLRTREFLSGSPKELKALGTPDAQFHIPLKRVKKRRVIVHPLSDLAQEILAELIEDKNQAFIIPGKGDGEPFDRQTLSKAVRGYTDKKGRVVRQGICNFLGMDHWTPHDLRRTAASLAFEIGFDESDISKCLDHKKDKGEDAAPRVTGVYVREGIFPRSRKLDKKREILDAVAVALREIIGQPPASAKRPPLRAVA